MLDVTTNAAFAKSFGNARETNRPQQTESNYSYQLYFDNDAGAGE